MFEKSQNKPLNIGGEFEKNKVEALSAPNEDVKSKVTKLIIEKENIIAGSATDNLKLNIKSLSINRGQTENPINYYKLSNLSRTSSIQVLMRAEQGLKDMCLPPQILDNIAKFIRENSKNKKEEFDCVSFVHFVNDMPYERGHFNPLYWDISFLSDDNNLKSGDTIFIASPQNPANFNAKEITHFAIYLGDELYLSKGGSAGPMIVTTLEEMKHGYKGMYPFIAKPKKEQIETPRKRLELLERSGAFVFHGSPDIIDVLEPRQAGGHNKEVGNWEDDGGPGIFASSYADCAIFRSLIYGKELENEMAIDDNNQLHFMADRKLFEKAKNNIGKVYVLDKNKFGDFRGMDCKSKEPVSPIEVIEVTADDLPRNIKIIE